VFNVQPVLILAAWGPVRALRVVRVFSLIFLVKVHAYPVKLVISLLLWGYPSALLAHPVRIRMGSTPHFVINVKSVAMLLQQVLPNVLIVHPDHSQIRSAKQVAQIALRAASLIHLLLHFATIVSRVLPLKSQAVLFVLLAVSGNILHIMLKPLVHCVLPEVRKTKRAKLNVSIVPKASFRIRTVKAFVHPVVKALLWPQVVLLHAPHVSSAVPATRLASHHAFHAHKASSRIPKGKPAASCVLLVRKRPSLEQFRAHFALLVDLAIRRA
jgi:hypothetical protein